MEIITLSKIERVRKYFVYQHIRVDYDTIFYIGIGTQPRNGLLYERAYTSWGRNPSWKGVARFTNYRVEIVAEFDTREEAESLEKLLIAKYGRKDLGLGPLTNRTDGGEKVKAPRTKTKSDASKGVKSPKRSKTQSSK